MTRYRHQVAAALHAAKIVGPTRYAWLGRRSRPLPAALLSEMDDAQRRSYLVACLREELYSSFYCYGRAVPARWGEREPVFADPSMVEAMSQTNTGRGGWEPGWTVEHLAGEEAVVVTDRLRARVAAIDCRTSDGQVRPGASVSLRLPNELRALSPGFYTVVSEAMADVASFEGVVRVYWNVGPSGAAALVGALTSRLNADHVPFGLKVADHPLRLGRCDAAVLYLPSDAFSSLRDTVREVAVALKARLHTRIPAFTLEFAPGVGLAEDDGGGESFGIRRCALLADGIARAHEQGVAGLDAVAARFAEEGVHIDAPYLEPSLDGRHAI